ncbi:MAG: CoA transferase [Actinomycetota bacterium]
MTSRRGPLVDLRVIDLSTVVAAPQACRYLADLGADVIKVERADGDTTRRMGWRDPADDVTLMWKLTNRGKRSIVLDLRSATDRDVLLDLVEGADVLVENLRPGKLEALGLGPDVLHARNDRLVVTRVSGFGQTGPYAQRPGFATLAEAMSGYADATGEPGGGPHLPPIALGDEITAMVAAFATMAAVHAGVGQVVDVDLLTSMVSVMGPAVSAWFTEGYEQPRLGSGIPYSVPRGTYRCADGRWVAVSASSDDVAARVMALLGRGDDPRFTSFAGRVEHRDELDDLLAGWMAERSSAEVLAAFDEAQAAVAHVYGVRDLAADPHVAAREMLPVVDGVPAQGLLARFSRTPGRPGDRAPALDEHGDDVRREGWGRG